MLSVEKFRLDDQLLGIHCGKTQEFSLGNASKIRNSGWIVMKTGTFTWVKGYLEISKQEKTMRFVFESIKILSVLGQWKASYLFGKLAAELKTREKRFSSKLIFHPHKVHYKGIWTGQTIYVISFYNFSRFKRLWKALNFVVRRHVSRR